MEGQLIVCCVYVLCYVCFEATLGCVGEITVKHSHCIHNIYVLRVLCFMPNTIKESVFYDVGRQGYRNLKQTVYNMVHIWKVEQYLFIFFWGNIQSKKICIREFFQVSACDIHAIFSMSRNERLTKVMNNFLNSLTKLWKNISLRHFTNIQDQKRLHHIYDTSHHYRDFIEKDTY